MTLLINRFACSLLLFVLAMTSAYADTISGNNFYPNTKIWVTHFKEDILPYWVMQEALGTPVGNFPTFRDMSGKPGKNSDRYVRTIARQAYTYFIGYLLTGDERLISYARSGVEWIEKHAVEEKKGFYTKLDEAGRPISKSKSAQDLAYIALAYSADYFVTRNPTSQRRLDEVIELIFEGPFWSSQRGMIIDALDNDLLNEVEFENDGADIVSILDQVNAYLLLYANQIKPINKKRAILHKLRLLGDLLIERFYSERIFWNTDLNRVDYGAKHIDTGHTMKTYWMLHRINRLWQDEFKYNLYRNVLSNIKPLMIQAYGIDPNSFWGMRFSPYLGITKTNPDWWIQIELNQLAADLSISDKTFAEMLNSKSRVWLQSNFVDRSRPVRGIRDGVRWDNSLFSNEETEESKAHQWKNGFHETEHCLVLNITSHAILEKPLTLYFALASKEEASLVKPYFYFGRVVDINDQGKISNFDLHKFAVTFADIK